MGERRAATGRRSLDDILRTLRDHMPDLRENHGVRSLAVFGSYVRGQQRKRSDLDVLVEFEQAPTLFGFMDLEEELSRLLGVKVDLVSRKALKGEIGSRILEEAIVP
ncbi:MAG: nucleotidyltransferase family protein [Chloroflexi bacterium]|nr:nucleotidyltransferase family protein [Chloroflexota bacterium]